MIIILLAEVFLTIKWIKIRNESVSRALQVETTFEPQPTYIQVIAPTEEELIIEPTNDIEIDLYNRLV
jgi:hypothetical protein